MKEERGTGAEAESQSQLVAKEDNKGEIDSNKLQARLNCTSQINP